MIQCKTFHHRGRDINTVYISKLERDRILWIKNDDECEMDSNSGDEPYKFFCRKIRGQWGCDSQSTQYPVHCASNGHLPDRAGRC